MVKILDEELKRRYEERRTEKTSQWTNWIVRIILLMAVLLLIVNFSDLHLRVFGSIFQSKQNSDKIEIEETLINY